MNKPFKLKNKLTKDTKEDKIHSLTTFTLEEIKKMNDKEFWTNITYLLAKGVISKEQHIWLDRERTKGWYKEPIVVDVLETFGGKLLKE